MPCGHKQGGHNAAMPCITVVSAQLLDHHPDMWNSTSRYKMDVYKGGGNGKLIFQMAQQTFWL